MPSGHSRRKMISLAGTAGAGGITKPNLARLLDRMGSNSGGNSLLSRKAFLRAAAAAAGTIACGGDGGSTGPDDIPLPDPIARIQGPNDLQLASLGRSGLVQYDSGGSTPASVHRHWKMKKVLDSLAEGEMDLGDGRTAQAELVRPGDYTVELRIVTSGKEDTTTHTTRVLPPPAPAEDYPLPAFMRREDNPLGSDPWVLYVINSSGQPTRIGGGPSLDFFPVTASWEPGGTRLALERSTGELGAFSIYDFMTDELAEVNTPGAGQLLTVAWNPKKDWIAYSDTGRSGHFEPALIRPDGSERKYISGAAPLADVRGYYPSWSPDGEQLVVGWTPYDITDSFFEDWRNTVYSGLWNGNPTGTRIPTEDQLVAFLDTLGSNTTKSRESINPCANGLAWSPDGDWLAYTLQFWTEGGVRPRDFLVKSRMDGTGDIETLVEWEDPPGSPVSSLQRPFWSPNGNFIYFTARYPREIMRISANGGTPSNVTSGHDDYGLAWYG